MDEMYKVSVIIPVYNVENEIERCLNSIIVQTYKNIEIIIIDDGSTDNTKKIIDRFVDIDNRIIYVHKKNGGPSSARNSGINISSGDYIVFVDGNDCVDKNMIFKLVCLIIEGDYNFVRCNYYLSTNENQFFSKGKKIFTNDGAITDNSDKKKLINDIIRGKIPTFVWLLIVRKDFIMQIRHFDENIDYMEDKLFYIDLFSKASKFYLSNDYLYYYYFNKSYNKKEYYWINYLKNINAVFKGIKDILISNQEFNKEYDKIINSAAFTQINECLYRIYCINNQKNIEEVFKSCNIEFITKLNITMHNSLYSNISICFANLNLLKQITYLYRIKFFLSK